MLVRKIKFLQIRRIRLREHLFFNLLEFRFFSESEGGMPFFLRSNMLHLIIAIPYVFLAEAIFLHTTRFFVTVDRQIAGLFSLSIREKSIFINTLSVAPNFRRLGIATSILDVVTKLARRTGKEMVELSVLKTNRPALNLYLKFGMTLRQNRKWSLILECRA